LADDFLVEPLKIKNAIFRRGKKGGFQSALQKWALQEKGDFLFSWTVQKKGGFFFKGLCQQKL